MNKPVVHSTRGKWIEKKTKSLILVCPSCGAKYIQTRKGQNTCVACMHKS